MPTSDEEHGVYQLTREYYALPGRVFTAHELAYAQDLHTLGELTVLNTLIGPVYTLDPEAACLPGRWSVKGPGPVTDAASLATLRLILEAQGGHFDRYQISGQAQLAAPGERRGVPTGMTMQVPGTLFGLSRARVPCLAFSTISGGGISHARARELLQTHRLLKDGDYHLIIGTLDPGRFGRLEEFQGPDGQRALVQQLPFWDDHAR